MCSCVQKVEDVQLIRKVLKEAGGEHIKIISKIENEIGLRNIDDIIQVCGCGCGCCVCLCVLCGWVCMCVCSCVLSPGMVS